MPKTNDNTGATAAGMSGIVEHGAPLNDGRTLSELDPEVNLDGTLIDGEHPDKDEADCVERNGVVVTDPIPQPGLFETEEQRQERREDEKRAREEQGDRAERTSADKTHTGEGLVTDAKSEDVRTPADVKAVKADSGKGGEDVSVGSSSAASNSKTDSSSSKNAKTNR